MTLPFLKRFKKLVSGFTLVELLVVMSIISIISGISFSAYDNAKDKARDKTRKENLTNIKTALVSYYQDFGAYPPDPAVNPGTEFSSTTGATDWIPGLTPYIQKLPKDPRQAGIFTQLANLIQNIRGKEDQTQSPQQPGQVAAANAGNPGSILANAGAGGFVNTCTAAGPDVPFTNGDNAKTTDGLYASATATNTSNCTNGMLFAYNFPNGASIPAGSTINGIVVGLARRTNTTNNSSTDYYVQLLKAGFVVGTPKNPNTLIPKTTVTVQNFGSSTDLWDTTWTASDINNIAVAYQAKLIGSGEKIDVDSFLITVYYTPPDPNLLVTSVTTNKSSYVPNETISITSTVTNNGTAAADGFSVGYIANGPASTPACPTNWMTYGVNGPFAVSAIDIRTVTYDAPSTPGTYQVGVYADANPCNQVAESNKADNYATSAVYTVTTPTATPSPSPSASPSPTPTATPVPSPSPTPSATPAPLEGAKNVFGYSVSVDRQYFILWAQLDNPNDPELRNSSTAKCQVAAPLGSSLNYCLESTQY